MTTLKGWVARKPVKCRECQAPQVGFTPAYHFKCWQCGTINTDTPNYGVRKPKKKRPGARIWKIGDKDAPDG